MTTDAETYVIDTHALVWYFTGDAKLSPIARGIIDRSQGGQSTLVIPTIVLAELLTIVEKRGARLSLDAMLDWMISNAGVVVQSFDLLVFAEMLRIPTGLELHDRIIAATAQQYSLPVITRDPVLAEAVQAIW